MAVTLRVAEKRHEWQNGQYSQEKCQDAAAASGSESS